MTVHSWALVVALVSIGLWSVLNFYVYTVTEECIPLTWPSHTIGQV